MLDAFLRIFDVQVKRLLGEDRGRRRACEQTAEADEVLHVVDGSADTSSSRAGRGGSLFGVLGVTFGAMRAFVSPFLVVL